MKPRLIIFFALLASFTSFSQLTDDQVKELIQNSDEDKLLSENSRMMAEGSFFQAEMIADKLLTYQPESPNYNYRKGFLALEIRKDYQTAIPFLTKAIKDTKPHYDAFSAKEQSAPADAFYHLGNAYQLSGNMEKAIEYYNLFLTNSSGKSETIRLAKLKIAQCENAKKAIAAPINVALKNLGKAINTNYPDYSPVISLDGSALYFTSRRPWENNSTENFRDPAINQYPEDVYVSYMDYDSSWTEAMKLDFCLPKRNEATIAVSSDERRVYLYEDSTGSGDIYYSDFYAAKFNDIKALNITGLNTEFWETHCMMSHDGSRLFFSSDRPGGFGGRDLYVIKKTGDTTWSEPINLGDKINTAFDEDAPFVSVDNKMLYFSSNGEKSIGGFDILTADLLDNGTWSESRNLGYPFNSTNDDIYYTTTIDGLRGYLTSFRGDGFGEKDIYEVNNDFLGVKSLAVLKGLIRNYDNSPLPEDFPVAMTLKCKDCTDEATTRTIYPRLKDGVFITNLQPCKTYVLAYVNANDKVNMYEEEFKTECTEHYQEITKEVILNAKKETITPVKNYIVNGIIADKETKAILPNSKIEVIDLRTNKVIETVYADANGNFKMKPLTNRFIGEPIDIQLKVSKDDYITQTYDLTQKLGPDEKIKVKVDLNKAEIGADLASLYGIKNIYFDFDKAIIRKDAKRELDKIVKVMNNNPTMEIELGSHTDCRGSSQYNEDLSDRRAKASADYIKSRISNPERIYGKGYGESKLVNKCECEGESESTCSPQEHQLNRRTEFRIVKK
ncbi:MAG: hypothetical protein RI922_209 [Bacteroidota bacterium]|jgi:outer membrane protein OmpA-like peptidoglycan-associated protein/tetratricopeptide (TPR) repeat protein